jgi:DNA-binding CsgD family transcriptional regulator
LADQTPDDTAVSGINLLARIQTLTARETEVLEYLLKGLSNDQIALALFRSPKTVDKHCQRIYRKLDVHRRVNLVRLCLESGYSGGQVVAPLEEAKPIDPPSLTDDDSYTIVKNLLQKSKAWDRVAELNQILAPISGPRYFGEFVCALTRVFGVRYAGISEAKKDETCGIVIAYSEDGKLIQEMDEYEIEGTPCKYALRDGRYFIPEGACSVFPSDEYLTKTSTQSYAGVRLDDRILGTLGLVWICDDKRMHGSDMHLEALSLIACSVAAELAVQVMMDKAGET